MYAELRVVCCNFMLKSLAAAETLSAWSYCSASDSERPSTLLSGTSVSDDRQRLSTSVWPD